MSSVVVDFKDKQEIIDAKPGENLLSALRRAGYSVPAACGGRGRCGKCRVSVNGISRLACKVEPADGDVVTLPEHSGGRILTETLPIVIDVKEKRKHGYVAAIDLGTTTIALRIYEFQSGEELCTLTQWNKQAAFGGDVVSRMDYCLSGEEHLQELSVVIRGQCEEMISEALAEYSISKEELLHITIAGNTVMQHIFAGYPIDGIARAPFQPYSLFEEVTDGLFGAPIFHAPCVSGYVGGDITAGILASDLPKRSGAFLFLDIGTNGEMALGGQERFLCCAVASGPAFEGAGISCGMAGVDGAISHIRYDHGFLYDVIGCGQPKGLCGSGLIDLVAELLRLGCIDDGGRLLPPEEVPDFMQRYLERDADGNGLFRLNKNVWLTARDVRNLQLAKAAVAGGIEVLLSNYGIVEEQLEGIYLAGGFGAYIHPESAIRVGLLPDIELEKLHVVGNTSLAGASMMALNPSKTETVKKMKEKMDYIELSGRSDFAEAFTLSMRF